MRIFRRSSLRPGRKDDIKEVHMPTRTVKRKTGGKKPRILIVTPEITYLPEGMGNLAGQMSAKAGGMADVEHDDLSGTQIASLPDNLTVGGGLDLRNTQIDENERAKVKTINNGDYVPGKYLFVDNILTQVKSKKTVGQYTVYVGKIKGQNVVSDGVNYAHCNKIRDGIADLLFKTASDRGADQYKNLSHKKPFHIF